MHNRHSRLLALLLMIGLLSIGTSALCRAQDEQNLRDPTLNTLPIALGAGAPVTLLPAGAFLHCSLSHPGASLAMLDGLAMRFVPEKSVPPQFKGFLASSTPLLAMLGSMTVGVPLTPANLASTAGLDVSRPVTLSWYTQDVTQGWVLTLPLAKEDALNGLLMGILRPTSCVLKDLGGKSAWLLECGNQSLPERMVVARSADTIVLFGSESIARIAIARVGRLADDPLLANLGSGDLEIAISPKPLQPILAMVLGQLRGLSPATLHAMHVMAMARIPAEAMASLNLNLRLRTGMRDFNQLLDYAECLIGATNEVMVPALGKTLMGIKGIETRVDLTPEGVALRCSAFADGIESLASAPLPLDAIKAAVAGLPWIPLTLSAEGRAALNQRGSLVKPWCDALTARLNAAGLEPAVLGAFVRCLLESKPVNSLASRVPWTLSCSGELKPLPKATTSLSEYARQVQSAPDPSSELVIMPDQGPSFPANYFDEVAKDQNANLALTTGLMAPYLGDDRWIDPVWRFHAEDRSGKAAKLVCESAYVTRSGWFGYSQHEFINRTIYFADHRGPLCLLQLAQGDALTWLDAGALPPVQPSAALNRLVAGVEPGSDRAIVIRLMPILPVLIDGIAAVEATAHTEIDTYLQRAQDVITTQASQHDAMMKALVALPMPFLVASLNIDSNRHLYCVLGGNLRYPRPLVSETLRNLLADVLPDAGHLGGAVISTKASPGVYSLQITCDLRGVASFTKTVGNAIWTQFLGSPNPLQALQTSIGSPLDGEPNPSTEVIVYSSLWPHAQPRAHRSMHSSPAVPIF